MSLMKDSETERPNHHVVIVVGINMHHIVLEISETVIMNLEQLTCCLQIHVGYFKG